MDIFGKKAKLKIDALEEHIQRMRAESSDQQLSQQLSHIAMLETVNQDLEESIAREKETMALLNTTRKENIELHEALEKEREETEAYVKLVFADGNYQVVTPHIATTARTFEELFNIRAIDDTQHENHNAIRLSLLNLAREALEQICGDFMGDIE